jgi:hypothetical protein
MKLSSLAWVPCGLVLALAMTGCGDDEPEVSVTYCEVKPILDEKCRRCHGDPLANDAPVPLATFDDIHAEYPEGTGDEAWQLMEEMVSGGVMPPLPLKPTDGKGPVQPLTDDESSLLLEWLEAGAPRGEGCSAE